MIFDDEDLYGMQGGGLIPAAPAAPSTPAVDPIEAELEARARLNSKQDAYANLADKLASSNSYGNYFLKTLNPETHSVRDIVSASQKNSDPIANKQKAMAYLKSKRDSEQMLAGDKADSPDSIAMQEQISGLFPKFAPFIQGKSKAQIQEMLPLLTQKIKGDTDRETAEIAAGARKEARADAERARMDAIQSKREDRAEARALKQQELSPIQAKQRGLYESGKLAEEQYNTAVGDKSEFDPTGVGQVIDNSEWAPNWMKNSKAVESQAAQSAWVEGFLRDASGAAIPPNERMAYAKDFFPRPGDTPEVVANKAKLRQQKMENARVASGVETGHGPAIAKKPSTPQTPQERAQAALERKLKAKQMAGK